MPATNPTTPAGQPSPTANRQLFVPALRPIVWLLAIVGALIFTTQLPVFRIQQVEVGGTADQTILDALGQLKEHSVFSRSVSQIPNQLTAKNLAIAGVSCHRGIPNLVRCEIETRQPAISWKKGDQQFWVDEQGLIYSLAQATQLKVPIVEDRANQAVEIGTRIASPELVTSYRQIVESLTAAGLTVEQLFITDSVYQVGAVITGHQNLSTPPGPAAKLTVLMVTTSSLENQVITLLSVLRERGQSIADHLDVRVPGYAYYK